jgi:hypothetical protein
MSRDDFERLSQGMQDVRQLGGQATGLVRDFDESAGGRGCTVIIVSLLFAAGVIGIFLAFTQAAGKLQALTLAASLGLFLSGILYRIFARFLNKVLLIAVVVGLAIAIFVLVQNSL